MTPTNTYKMPSSDDRLLWELWLSAQWLPSVMAADDVGIFRFLTSNPATSTEIAAHLGLNPRVTSAITGLLNALGLLASRQELFYITDTARHYLDPDSPFYWGGLFVIYRRNNPGYLTLRAALKKSDLSSQDGSQSIRNQAMEAWKSRELSLEKAREIASLMQSHSLVPAISLANNINYAQIGRILDVGGGSGCFSIALAKCNPKLRCTIMDLPAMCEVARDYVITAGLEDRIDIYPADMFKEIWPLGHDLIFFSNIFHDWSAELCLELAMRAYEVLPSGGEIHLHEMLLEDSGSQKPIPAAFSVLMNTYTDGTQFTFAEIRKILSAAGFRDIGHALSSTFFSLISARK